MASEADLQRRIQRTIVEAGGYVYKTHGNAFGKAGTPDLIGCLWGVPFALEVKQPGQRATKLQSVELARWASVGFCTGVVTTATGTLDIIRAHGARLTQIEGLPDGLSDAILTRAETDFRVRLEVGGGKTG